MASYAENVSMWWRHHVQQQVGIDAWRVATRDCYIHLTRKLIYGLWQIALLWPRQKFIYAQKVGSFLWLFHDDDVENTRFIWQRKLYLNLREKDEDTSTWKHFPLYRLFQRKAVGQWWVDPATNDQCWGPLILLLALSSCSTNSRVAGELWRHRAYVASLLL